jgi:hypothetical protein
MINSSQLINFGLLTFCITAPTRTLWNNKSINVNRGRPAYASGIIKMIENFLVSRQICKDLRIIFSTVLKMVIKT